MPNARPTLISFICEWLKDKTTNDIKSVLDIGCGFGKWGFLARLYIQIWDTDITKTKYRNWRENMRVDAVEVYSDYITDLQKLIYNEIFVGDIREIIDKIGVYDLIFFGDVLEHMGYDEGLAILEYLNKRSKYLLITMPVNFYPGHPIMGNELEVHRHIWANSEFPGEPQIVKIKDQRFILYKNK